MVVIYLIRCYYLIMIKLFQRQFSQQKKDQKKMIKYIVM